MLALEAKNPLLSDIKSAIENIIFTGNQANGSVVSTNIISITDKLRHEILKILVSYSDKIPHPASGTRSIKGDKYKADKAHLNTFSNTLIRWQILAYVASIDLTIAKWFESHLDALSILHELSYEQSAQRLWAVWAAEGHPLSYQQGKISGSKAWCSGANIVDHCLMTYRDKDGQAQLLMVDMHQNGIKIDNSAWQAVGMQATDTATIHFDQVVASNVGAANAYLERVGFWHGAAGVAACWYGAATCLASYLISAYQQKPNDYKAMYLGQIGTALAVTQQYFHHLAELIDNEPTQSHELAIRQLRSNVEQLAREVIEVVGQALGAAPFCNNPHFARLSADLTVFIRQSHGAFDLQKIGELSSMLASESASKLTNDDTSDFINRQENIWQL
ncbi:acyl-CoA dehydrogenase family protein [uncultured Psychrobacter sp.]|uniref:acyl-CoA dehydrogenase family protein n=1 Tax=uncultured Psychrobacter sp. TaxID=259303 RepID=UPI00262DD616|nr:acyl-CoA dehydrogenase family protein [uncultured Psychrobacter sp.]